jgi:hypothetical protein
MLLWSLLGAAWAWADTLLGPGSMLTPVSSDLSLWLAALIGVELVVAAFEWVLELLGQQIKAWDYGRRAATFIGWHEEANEPEQAELFDRRHE